MPYLPASGPSNPGSSTGVSITTGTGSINAGSTSSFSLSNASGSTAKGNDGHHQQPPRIAAGSSSQNNTATAGPSSSSSSATSSSAAQFYGTNNNARNRPESSSSSNGGISMKRDAAAAPGNSGDMVVATSTQAAATSSSNNTMQKTSTSKKSSKNKGSSTKAGGKINQQPLRDVMSDAPPQENSQSRRQSAAMARDLSNTSNASTRSLPARVTRGSKRKYLEESSSTSSSDADDDVIGKRRDRSQALLKPPAITTSKQQKGKGRQAYTDGGNSTAPQSRSTSPEAAAKLTALPKATLPSASGLSIRLKQSTPRQQAAPIDSTPAKGKRKKKRIDDLDDDAAMVQPSSSRLPSEAPTHVSMDDPGSSKLSQVEMVKDEEAAATSDSSASTPLASATLRSSQAAPSALEGIAAFSQDLQAKTEPVSEAEDDGRTSTRAGSASSLPNGDEIGSRAPTIATSRATSAAEEDGDIPGVASSRASVASEPTGLKILLPSLNDRSVSAIEGGDEFSTGAQSTAMPSPADEIDKELGQVKKSIPAAPPPAKKRRGRPPKKRPLSETPGPMSEDMKDTTSTTPQAAVEPVFSGIKARYHATLKNERALIEEGTHPLFLQALIDYDKIKAEKLAMLNLTLRTKEDSIQKAREGREKSLWESWQDERRKLWYELTLGYTKKQRQLVFEKDTMEAEAIDPAGLFGTAKTILWPDRDPTCSLVNPPVVDPLIRVPIISKPPQKGRTRSSNKSTNIVGEAIVVPINTKTSEGISALSRDEIDLDLEVMGLSKQRKEDNWFHNAVTEEEAQQQAELQRIKEEEIKMENDLIEHDMSLGDSYLPPGLDPDAQIPPSYPYSAPYDYAAWPPYPDPRYPTGPPYNPYYPVPPYPTTSSVSAAAADPGFHFPTASVSQEPKSSKQKQKKFSFPKSRNRDSFDGKSGHSKDDAILIDDDGIPIASGATVQKETFSHQSGDGRQSQRQADQYDRELLKANHEPGLVRIPYEGYEDPHRYPQNVYRAGYDDQRRRRRGTGEENSFYSTPRHGHGHSPDPNLTTSPHGQEHAVAYRERRASSGEWDARLAASLDDMFHTNTTARYRPYYDSSRGPSGMREDIPAPGGYPPDLYVDPWGRPVDPYLPPAYYHHPGYRERGLDGRYRGNDAPPPDAYREDQRSRYRQYSAQSDDLYHATYAPPHPSYSQHPARDSHPGRRDSFSASAHRSAKSPERDRLSQAGYHTEYRPQRH